VRVSELRFSTTLKSKAVKKHCTGVLCLDNAFALIEGHPRYVDSGRMQQSYCSLAPQRRKIKAAPAAHPPEREEGRLHLIALRVPIRRVEKTYGPKHSRKTNRHHYEAKIKKVRDLTLWVQLFVFFPDSHAPCREMDAFLLWNLQVNLSNHDQGKHVGEYRKGTKNQSE
jgi:hypothetical protein